MNRNQFARGNGANGTGTGTGTEDGDGAGAAARTAGSAGAEPAPRPLPRRQQIYQQLRAAIVGGSLAPGARLPPTREHARLLGVGRNTVLWALERLRAEGFVRARVGDGSYVAGDLPLTRAQPLPAVPVLSRRGAVIADTALRWQPATGAGQTAARAFRIGAPEVAGFPFALWDRLARQHTPSQRQALAQYLDPAGLPALREAIAQWLLVSRGVRCNADQVLVTAGSQQAIDLVGRLLLDAGDMVWVEDPGYPGIRASLAGHGATVQPVPVDAEGLDLASAQALAPAARLAVVTPTHQFPLGVRMSLARRLALIDWARRHEAWIVEDDYDGEFQYGAHRTPALCSLAHGGRVLYVGTFSKSLHPGLRLGFLVLPAALQPAFAAAKALSDRHSAGEAQAVLARFIAEGHLLRHLRRMRELYQGRQARLIERLAAASGGALRAAPSAQGMHLALEIAPGADDATLARQATAAGVWLAPLSRYALASPRRGWVLGYAAYDAAKVDAALDRLAPLLRRAGPVRTG